jgi:hypothetical protein
MLNIYIEEAHAYDEWYLPEATEISANPIINVHKTLQDRIDAAKKFISDKNNPINTVVDSMNGDVSSQYDCWPERLYIILDGVVVYKGGYGPFDYRIGAYLTNLSIYLTLFIPPILISLSIYVTFNLYHYLSILLSR